MYADNELLYPSYVTKRLRAARGEAWRELVEHVARLPQDHPENLAFSLLMIRLNGCLKCETDSYRAMRGCTACAHQTLRRFKPGDRELLKRYHRALEDICVHLEIQPLEPVLAQATSARAA